MFVAIFVAARTVAVAAALVLVALATLDPSDRGVWHTNGGRLSVTIGAGCALLMYVVSGVLNRVLGHRSRAIDADRDLHAVLNAGVLRISETCGLPWYQVGVHAFRLSGPWFLPQRLVCTGRAGGAVVTGDTVWVPGRGAVGSAFANRRTYTDASWTPRPTARSRGLVARPVFHPESRLTIGCIAVDAPLPLEILTGGKMQTILNDLATAVGGAHAAQPGWTRWR